MNGDIRLTFIQKSLQDYMSSVVAAMRREITRRNVIVTADLLNSLSYRVYQQAAEGNANLDFAEWGRFVDMGVGKGHPLGGLDATKQLLASKDQRPRKPNKIYSPIAYGKLNGLMGDLLYGFTEETVTRIKQELNAAAINNGAAV